MDEEENFYDWNDLPTVALLDVYSTLSVKDKLSASSTCRNWRLPVFQAPLMTSLDLVLNSPEQQGPKIRFLIAHVVHKVSHLSLTFNGGNREVLTIVEELLNQLEKNRSLVTLKLRCTEESVVKSFFSETSNSARIRRKRFIGKVIFPVGKVLQSINCLETFSFPLVQELVQFASIVFSILETKTKKQPLQNLFLYTLRTALPDYFGGIMNLPSTNLTLMSINAFINLKMLGIDHEVVNDELLSKLGVGSRVGGLGRLNLIALQPNHGMTNDGWVTFCVNNPNCKVRLTVTGRTVSVDHRSNLLFPSTPLSHFRAIHCKGIRMTALNSLVSWNENSLEHLELVDENHDFMEYIAQPDDVEENHFLDPIIYAAWRCVKLHTIKIGFQYCGQSLVGIARLKGPKLTCFEISKSQVIYHNMQQLSNEVSKALSRAWKPLDDSQERKKFRSDSASRRLVHISRTSVFDENNA